MDGKIVINDIVKNIEKVIMGKTTVIYDIMKVLISSGHVLIEDVPGVGKTALVKALAKSVDLSFNRIQFTPDLLPSDITGISIYNQQKNGFEFNKGPIFSNIILADEINRTSPKTQSALLEVMEENQISEGNNTYKLDKPFMVLATQNPVEFEGTFILPEAQLDRFMMKVSIGYAGKNTESKILQVYGREDPYENLSSVTDGKMIINIQDEVKKVFASQDITDYIVKISDATRNNKYITLGASTRASLALLKIAKAAAYIDGRDYVVPLDVKDNAKAVFSHRIIISPNARASNLNSLSIIQEIIDKIPQPVVRHD